MFKHLKTKLLAFIIPSLILILVCVFEISAVSEFRIVNNETKEKMFAIQGEQTKQINSVVESMIRMVTHLSIFVEHSYDHESLQVYEEFLSDIAETKHIIYGVGIWFEPYAYDVTQKYVAPFVYTDEEGQTKVTYDYSTKEYNYFAQQFYTDAKHTGDIVLTNPYYDEVGDVFILTCAMPFYDEIGNFLGVVTVDFELMKVLQSFVASYNTEYNFYYIIDKEGTFIGSNNIEQVKKKESILNSTNPSFLKAAREVMEHASGIENYEKDGETYVAYYNEIDNFDWKLVTVINRKILYEPIYQLLFYYILKTIVSVILMTIAIWLIMNRNLERPIQRLVKECEAIASLQDEQQIAQEIIQRKDEIGILGNAMGAMKEKLLRYRDELKKTMEENQEYSQSLKQHTELLEKNNRYLEETLEYNKVILRAIPDLLFIVSKEGYILECNGNRDILLLKERDLLGKHISELPMKKEDMCELQEKISNVVSTRQMEEMGLNLIIHGRMEYYLFKATDFMEDKIVVVATRTTDLYHHEEEVNYLKNHDPLTGLYNRVYFESVLKMVHEKKEYPLAVIVSDVNGLKLINNSFGQEIGNKLLVKYAEILQDFQKDYEYIFRTGGDDFTILLPNTTTEKVMKILFDIETSVLKEQVSGIPLSVSFGCSVMERESESFNDAVRSAEKQMNRQKLYENPGRREKTIELIVSTLQEKNPREQQHSNRVAELSERLAEKLGMTLGEQKRIHTAGILHDIGKIGIPEELLNKPGKLTKEEYETICKHPEIGHRILMAAGNMEDIAEIIFAHHEKWDGTGYPRQLKEKEISLESRIIMIVDTYDAMTSDRSYRKGLSKDVAVAELIRCKGTQFDPELIDVFVDMIKDSL